MADAFEVLGEEHDQIRGMLAELERGPGAPAGADEAQLRARKQVVMRLVTAASAHEAAEEQHFWPVVRDRVDGGGRLASQAARQEEAGAAVLAQLDGLEAWEEGFDQLVTAFTDAAREHMAFEEAEVWPRAGRALRGEELAQLGKRLAEARAGAPARPRPRTPPAPSALKTTGRRPPAGGPG